MADYRSPVYKAPPRKPVPGNAGFQFHTLDSRSSSSSPHLPEGPSSHLHAGSISSSARPASTQYRPRTASSSFLPADMLPVRESIAGFPQPQQGQQQGQQFYQQQQHQQQHQQQQQQQYSQRQFHQQAPSPQNYQQQQQQQFYHAQQQKYPQRQFHQQAPSPQNYQQQQQQQFYHAQQQKYPQHQLQAQYGAAPPSRRASNATTCTTSTGGGNAPPVRQMSQVSFDTRYSTISQRPQISYVALMRKQKATVWCDRAQAEDPRLLAQRRAAKQRALLEVHGSSSTRSSTLISAGKIRHSGNGRSISYNTSTMVGAGVPLRLSANEVGGADDELDDRIDASQLIHRCTGSSRSSTTSNRISAAHQRAGQTRLSSSSSANNTPPNADIPDIVETPAATLENIKDEDFLKKPNRSSANTASDQQRPATSHSEEEDEFGKITEMAAPTGMSTAMQKRKISDDLKRRGSVDERTSSMTGVRLFVANPDLSD
ncbi:hypothetical protein H109_00882 [Trichophyton interdigitale MR816]|uniref:Uncharacterized protein n=1 Tax=Trichophyton interdigitale (strain MR816) TaxID=1215338 RepID=A0A059JHG8_TRIIM|nr:hypothetical protein H109_00882 [Trichophyton interdigitale MR816]